MVDPVGPATQACRLRLRLIDDDGMLLISAVLEEDTTLSFGSSPGCDHTLSAHGLADLHFVLGLDAGGVWLEPACSVPTLLAGAPIAGRVPAPRSFEIEAGGASVAGQVELAEANRPLDPTSLLGLVVSGYQLEQIIGRGETSVVFAATQTAMGREVAFKVLDPGHTPRADLTERFLRTVALSGKINHPNLIQVYDSGQDHGRALHYVVMERVEGERLDTVLDRGPLSSDRVVDLMVQAASGLQHLHEQGVAHRNLHPGKVLILPGHQIKLIGLGFARTLSQEQTDSIDRQQALRQAVYQAPELLDGRRADASADVFSLGALGYRALTGRHPSLSSNPIEHLRRLRAGFKVPTPSREDGDVPPRLVEILDRCLAAEPGSRYPSASALRSELRPLLKGSLDDTMTRMQGHLLAMLPDSPAISGFDSAVYFQPSQGVGGDFYDVFDCTGGDHGVVIGDVTGHGMEVVSVVGMAKMAIRILARLTRTPHQALTYAHRELVNDLEATTFVSGMLLRIDPRTHEMTYVRAGHNPPLLINPARDPTVSELDASGAALGLLRNREIHLEQQTVQLQAGDLLFLYTDGITEASDLAGNQFGTTRLTAFLRSHYPQPAQQIALALAGVMEQYTREGDVEREQEDDRTALILKFAGG